MGKINKQFLGELIGTFILVFIGCSSVAVAVLFGNLSLWQVALIWVAAVYFGILGARKYSGAHLNPAVTLFVYFSTGIKGMEFLWYVLGQCLGALLAGLAVYLCFNPTIIEFELAKNIIRGTDASRQTAMMFGEFFPNPGFPAISASMTQAAFIEFGGTVVLLLSILFASKSQFNDHIKFLIISATVGVIIYFIAPYTQGGINPARDLFPRLVAAVMGWNRAAFPEPLSGFFFVYILAPSVAGVVVGIVNKRFKTHALM